MSSRPWLQSAWQQLTNQAAAGKIPHALLLRGPEGIGKRALADQLAVSLICQQTDANGAACEQCRNCQLVAAGSHPDLHVCEPETDSKLIKIDQIRALAARAALTSSGGHQVFIIDPADRMNVNAANAILKTLEEPNPGSVLILVASSLSRLPLTVVSRCQQVVLSRPERSEALDWLATQSDAAAEDIELALDAASGSPGLALNYLRGELLASFEQTAQTLSKLAAGQTEPLAQATSWVDDMLTDRLDWFSRWLVAIAANVAANTAQPSGTALNADRRLPGSLTDVAGKLTVQRPAKSLIMLADQVNRGRALLESAVRPELIVENLLIDWQQLFVSGRD